MSATTIKIEDKLLHDIRKLKHPDQSISSYVKKVLEHNIQQQRMAEAAQQYQAFLNENREEANSLQDWEIAPLDQAPRAKRR